MSSRKLLAVPTILALGIGMLAAPAGARLQGQPQTQTVRRAIVHGREAGVRQSQATSFEVFGSGRFPPGGTSEPGVPVRRAPMPVSGFDALSDPSFVPSDTTGGLGALFFVVAVNTQMAVYDRTGVQVVAPIRLEDLHPDSAGHFVFDPKVIYDPYEDTFVLVYLVEEDSPRLSRIITIAIPDATATDVGTWCATSFPGDALPGAPSVWADYPGLGYNDTRLTITTNQFEFPATSPASSFLSSQILTIDKIGLYDCSQTPVPTVFAGSQTRDDIGIQAFTLRPAETVGASPGAQLLLSFQLVNGKLDYLTVWRIKPTASGFSLKKVSIPTGKVSAPPFGSQGGGGLSNQDLFWDAGDFRLINAFYDAERKELFAAHAVFKDLKPDTLTGGYPEAVVRWYEVNPATKLRNSAISRKGVVGAPEVSVGWPSVATDDGGTLFVTYSRASDPHDEFLAAWVATIPPNSTAATQLLLHAGAATYDAIGGVERWGDYTAINRDPVSPENLATFNQYALSSSEWQQSVNVVTDV